MIKQGPGCKIQEISFNMINEALRTMLLRGLRPLIQIWKLPYHFRILLVLSISNSALSH